MTRKDPYQIIKRQHVTEKSGVLLQLKDSQGNASIRRFERPKYVFVVDSNATKRDIASAIEEIYSKQGVKVMSVNTINVKGKTRRVRGRLGKTTSFKKAVVTLDKGDQLENV